MTCASGGPGAAAVRRAARRSPGDRTGAGRRVRRGSACFACWFCRQHFLPRVSDCYCHVSCKSGVLFTLNEVTLCNRLVTMPSEGGGAVRVLVTAVWAAVLWPVLHYVPDA